MKKNMKKVMALALAASMTLGMTTAALADEAPVTAGKNEGQGTITVNNTTKDETYSLYRIFDLESWDDSTDDTKTDDGAYAYKVNSAWQAFIDQTEIKEVEGKETTVNVIKGVFVNVDGRGYVTWVEGADAARFAQLAIDWANANSVAKVGDSIVATVEDDEDTPADESAIKFENLDLGYYLIDSSFGTLCALDTTNSDVTVTEKNIAPTMEKEVKEDSTSNWGVSNTADFDQVVDYKVTINVPANSGAENYILHDQMATGLTFVESSVVVKNGSTTLTKDTHYTVETDDHEDCSYNGNCTFEVRFDNAYLESISDTKAGATLTIEYQATVDSELNDHATIGYVGNENSATLTYGDKSETVEDTTTTYVYDFDVFKYTTHQQPGEPASELGLAGAQFKLYRNYDEVNKTYSNQIHLVKQGDENIYYVCTDDKCDATAHTSAVVTPADGKFQIDGLDADTYYLEETVAPNGYNKLVAPVIVTITENTVADDGVEDHTGVVSVGYTDGDEDTTNTENMAIDTTNKYEVKVENKSGIELPSTGGMGTTIFYVLGSIMALGAGVLLFAKKRMGIEE